MSTREADGHPPDLPDLQTIGPILWEQAVDDLRACVRAHQALRLILDKGDCTCGDPWASLDIVTIDPDAYLGSASRGGKTFTYVVWGANCMLPELHAAPSAPQIFQFSSSPFPSFDTLTRKNPSCGEGAATEQRAAETRRPEASKSSNPHAEDLQEVGRLSTISGDSSQQSPAILCMHGHGRGVEMSLPEGERGPERYGQSACLQRGNGTACEAGL